MQLFSGRNNPGLDKEMFEPKILRPSLRSQRRKILKDHHLNAAKTLVLSANKVHFYKEVTYVR